MLRYEIMDTMKPHTKTEMSIDKFRTSRRSSASRTSEMNNMSCTTQANQASKWKGKRRRNKMGNVEPFRKKKKIARGSTWK